MTYSKVVAPGTHTTDAEFRAWATSLNDHLIAAGLIQTTDTGQLDLTTATRPGVSTYAGYRIYRFNDTLQSTAPVFIRIDFGTGTSATIPSVNVRVGTGTNGAGTLTGRFTAIYTLLPGASGSATYDQHVATGLDKSYLALAWYVHQSSQNCGGVLIVDRSRNTDGSPNGDGFYVACYAGTGSAITYTAAAMLPNTGGAVVAGSVTALSAGAQTSLIQGTEVSLVPHFCFTPKMHAPAKAVLSTMQTDLPYTGSTVTVAHYGNAPFISMCNKMSYGLVQVNTSTPTYLAASGLVFRAE